MKQHYFCNPVNVEYRYQFNKKMAGEGIEVSREAADPSMIFYKGKYYIFASMTLGVWVSEDMASWENHRLPDNLPLYDYAPDVRVVGEYVYFSASKRGEICNFYRTKDILNGPYEEIAGTFDFWDPNLFVDDDGRLYFYWGCDNTTPIWGVELDTVTMKPLTERKELIAGRPFTIGYERRGEDHCMVPTEKDIELAKAGNHDCNMPYIEGAWMTKYQGKYYLQYACPGAEYNVYADGVYVADVPLGPFTLARNNPFSYKPGGFLPGAGHGSTMQDREGAWWHTATMRISVNHLFERRVGIWPAGFDHDGELFCNQRYGDWPMAVEMQQKDPWCPPKWYLLSYGKEADCSSFTEGKEAGKAIDENVRTWWQAASNEDGQWIRVNLGKPFDVHAVQVNFADDKIEMSAPGTFQGENNARYIEEAVQATRWILEGSENGRDWMILKDKSKAQNSLPHDLVVIEAGIALQYIRLTILEVPYHQKPCISGLRVFGVEDGEKPQIPEYQVKRSTGLDMEVGIQGKNALGYNILWGHEPEKLYHSYMIFGKDRQKIGALVEGQNYYVRVDAFNEAGITEGKIIEVR